MIREEGASQRNLMHVNSILLNKVNASKKILAASVSNALEIKSIQDAVKKKQKSCMQLLELKEFYTRIFNRLIDKQISIKHQFEYWSYIEEYESMILNSRYLIHDKQSDFTDSLIERGSLSLNYVMISSRNMQKFICEGVRSKKMGEMIKERALLQKRKKTMTENKENTTNYEDSIKSNKNRAIYTNQTLSSSKNYTRLFFNKYLQSQTISQLYKEIECMDEVFQQNYQKYSSFTNIFNLLNQETHQLLKQLNQKSKLVKEKKKDGCVGIEEYEIEIEEEDVYDF